MDTSNLLKPALASGEISCLGSTTYKEYRNHFEKTGPWLDAFQKSIYANPVKKKPLKYLKALRGRYEEIPPGQLHKEAHKSGC